MPSLSRVNKEPRNLVNGHPGFVHGGKGRPLSHCRLSNPHGRQVILLVKRSPKRVLLQDLLKHRYTKGMVRDIESVPNIGSYRTTKNSKERT